MEGKRSGKVSQPERGLRPVEHGVDRFQFLAGLGVELPSRHKIGVRASRRPKGQVNHPAAKQCPSRPNRIAGTLQHTDRTAVVVQGRRIPAEVPQHRTAPVQHRSSERAATKIHGSVKRGKSRCRPARVDIRRSESRQHVGFTILRASPAGQAQCGPELADPRANIADVAKNDPGGLACYRSHIGIGPGSQDLVRPGQCFMRTGHRQRQQVVHLTMSEPGRGHAFHHGGDARSSYTGGRIRTLI